jgi:L-iditol 2-dehydrogenase
MANTVVAKGKMKAAYLTGRMKLDVREIDIPAVPRGGALVRVHSTGLCGSDLNRIRYTTSTEPRVIGHEVAGDIVAVDEGVTLFKPGERVAVAHVHIPCGHCRYCKHGAPAMCKQFKESRIIPGGYSQYIALSADHLAHTTIRIPEGVSYAAATFMDPVACCLNAINKSQVSIFDRVAVVGVGIMGQIFVQMLKELQAESFVMDVSQARLERARRYGANHVFNSAEGGVVEKILSLTNNEGVDVVLLTFLTQQILDEAMAYTRDGGKLVVFAPPIKELELKMNYFDFFRREMRMFSSYSSSIADIETTMQWIASKKVDVEDLITGYCTLDTFQSTVEAIDDRQLKIIVEP